MAKKSTIQSLMEKKRKDKISPNKVNSDEVVHITIRAQKRNRVHWQIEAKKEGLSLTQVITELLINRYGQG